MADACLDVWSGDGDGNYGMQMPGQTEMRARGKLRTDAQGRYAFWSIRPTIRYRWTARLVQCSRRWAGIPSARAIFISSCPRKGYEAVTTHLFVADSPYLDFDAVFGVRDGLIVEFESQEPGIAPDGRETRVPFHTANYDFRLTPSSSIHDGPRLVVLD